ncbi:MAG TPA: hypothetical protein PLG15_02525 [Candidatus Gastranaerophilaceae bacterium]|nr:hypothetical protein [Candidatus Gastranaerophilaceae bacterium]HPT41239.1 hypothetical protein [Candidatus Gastranaerophilaceae bacterium]
MKKGQTVIEYFLIFVLVALFATVFASKFDFKKIKNYVFSRPSSGPVIEIEPMTNEISTN